MEAFILIYLQLILISTKTYH